MRFAGFGKQGGHLVVCGSAALRTRRQGSLGDAACCDKGFACACRRLPACRCGSCVAASLAAPCNPIAAALTTSAAVTRSLFSHRNVLACMAWPMFRWRVSTCCCCSRTSRWQRRRTPQRCGHAPAACDSQRCWLVVSVTTHHGPTSRCRQRVL
jgi:hypothetical protein